MGQDRLWQMDCFRRRGQGRLAEILGSDHLTSDITHRTLSLDRLADREADLLDERTGEVLQALSPASIARLRKQATTCRLSSTSWGTGRNVASRRRPRRHPRFLVAAQWAALPHRRRRGGATPPAGRSPARRLHDTRVRPRIDRSSSRGLPARWTRPFGAGWLRLTPDRRDGHQRDRQQQLGGRWQADEIRAGVLGSDPHLPFALPGNWYECRLSGTGRRRVGAAWAGMPGIWFGRNRRIAWGLTNNNVSLRDLYVEAINPDNPGQYRDGDRWLPFGERTVEIPVRGREPERFTLRETTRGPIVNHIVSKVDEAGDPPLSLRWVGQEHLENVKALLAVNRSGTWAEFRAALADWAIPTFNWVFADVDGHVGYQCASRVPLRGRVTRGFRDANNPDDRWLGYISFDAMPRRDDPAEGFVATRTTPPSPKTTPTPSTAHSPPATVRSASATASPVPHRSTRRPAGPSNRTPTKPPPNASPGHSSAGSPGSRIPRLISSSPSFRTGISATISMRPPRSSSTCSPVSGRPGLPQSASQSTWQGASPVRERPASISSKRTTSPGSPETRTPSSSTASARPSPMSRSASVRTRRLDLEPHPPRPLQAPPLQPRPELPL